MRAQVVQRISSEEEERSRRGYNLTTHFSLTNQDAIIHSTVSTPAEETLLELAHAPAATLWRINHGWRTADQTGFTIEPQTGRWARNNEGVGSPDDEPDMPTSIGNIKTFVQDARNILMVKPVWEDAPEGLPDIPALRNQAGHSIRLPSRRTGDRRRDHRKWRKSSATILGGSRRRNRDLAETGDTTNGVFRGCQESNGTLPLRHNNGG